MTTSELARRATKKRTLKDGYVVEKCIFYTDLWRLKNFNNETFYWGKWSEVLNALKEVRA